LHRAVLAATALAAKALEAKPLVEAGVLVELLREGRESLWGEAALMSKPVARQMGLLLAELEVVLFQRLAVLELPLVLELAVLQRVEVESLEKK
jgi:hypothetical protein